MPHPPPSEDGRGKVPGKGHERPTEPIQLGRGGAGVLAAGGGEGRGGAGGPRLEAGLAGTRGQARRAVRAAAERAARRPPASHEHPARGCPAAAALQPSGRAPPHDPNHVCLLLLLFQGLWQFQEEIR